MTCPHCNNKTLMSLIAKPHEIESYEDMTSGTNRWYLFLCPVCKQVTLEHKFFFSEDQEIEQDYNGAWIQIWEPREHKILYPASRPNTLPLPHKDLPESLILDYEEARSIAHLSPRSAAALLRLLVEKLCVTLGAKGKGINDFIGYLVKEKNLSTEAQQAFDIIRLVGNNAVHPGEINLEDNLEIVRNLFTVINIAVEHLVTQPQLLEKLYSELPQQKLAAIADRDTNQ